MSIGARPSFGCATAETTQRFGKLLKLALISEQPGEILAALCALKRALASAGLDAHWLADVVERGAQPHAPSVSPDIAQDDRKPPWHRERDERSDAWFCFHRRDLLSPKERAFIENVIRWSSPLSPRQRQWIYDIADRLHCEAA
jgi:hypothetical protein